MLLRPLKKPIFSLFAPYAFHASVLLRDYKILELLSDHPQGCSFDDIFSKATISKYGVRILLEAGIESVYYTKKRLIFYHQNRIDVYLRRDGESEY